MERYLKKQLNKLWTLEDEDKNPEHVKMLKDVLKDTILLIHHLEQLKGDVIEILNNREEYQLCDIINLAECYTQIDDYEELERDYIATEFSKR